MSSLFLWFYCLDLPFALFLIAAMTSLFVALRQRFRKRTVWKPGIAALFCLWAVLVIWKTVLSRKAVPGASEIQPLFHSYLQVLHGGNREILRSNLMNVFLFYPAGLLIASLLSEKCKPAITIVLILFLFTALSIGIEFCQYRFGLGETEADDVLHNTLGAVSGALVIEAHNRVQRSSQKSKPV